MLLCLNCKIEIKRRKFCSCKCAGTYNNSKRITGKTYEEVYGLEKAKKLKNKISEDRTGNSSGICLDPEKEIKRREHLSQVIKKRYKEGWNPISGFKKTKYYTYKGIKVHGGLEVKTCFILDKLKENGLIFNWEYTNDRIQYFWEDGSEHTYLIDFKVFETENDFYYLEVKGWEQEVDKLKWEETKNQGYRIVIWKTKEINNYLKQYNMAVMLVAGTWSAKPRLVGSNPTAASN